MTDYKLLCAQAFGFASETPDFVPFLSNVSALLMQSLPELNWAGFYLVKGEELILGPFQGKPACIKIPKGRGVCGTAWETDETQLVFDVHKFPGHIACDSESNSEIVVPLHKDGAVVAVLDLDSPYVGRFRDEDKSGLEDLAVLIENKCAWKTELPSRE